MKEPFKVKFRGRKVLMCKLEPDDVLEEGDLVAVSCYGRSFRDTLTVVEARSLATISDASIGDKVGDYLAYKDIEKHFYRVVRW